MVSSRSGPVETIAMGTLRLLEALRGLDNGCRFYQASSSEQFGSAAPPQDEEFVMSHSDNVQSTGFVEHLKLPHYVDFQSELGLLRKLRQEFAEANEAVELQEAAE